MHPRNIHNKPHDFEAMAAKDERFRPYVRKNADGRVWINWKDAATVREFTRALLSLDYALQVEFPEDQLVPAVPSRANYIHHLHDLLHQEPERSDDKCRGIDIGTGASCVYPLLGAAIYGWSFVATDIDDTSVALARANVARNERLRERIEVRRVERGTMLVGNIRDDETFDFCMCNPPFFDAEAEEDAGPEGNPRTVCTANENELFTEGGEAAFVTQMLAESAVLGRQVRWYTSLLGRKVTLKTVRQVWAELGVRNTRVIELLQGRTTRWVVAWSFTEEGVAALAAQASKRARTSGRTTLQTKEPLRVLEACAAALRGAEWSVRTEAARFALHASHAASGVAFEVCMLQPRAGVVSVELKAKAEMRARAEQAWADIIEPSLAAFADAT